MDTRRFKIMKKFKWYIPNTAPTTTGGEALTADGLVVQNWSTTKVVDADNYMVLADINPKTYLEWEEHIDELYPDYRMMSRHDLNDDPEFSHMLTETGYKTSLTTILSQYNKDQPFHDLQQQKYAITNFLPQTTSLNPSPYDQLWRLYQTGSFTGEIFTETPSSGAHQCILIKRTPYTTDEEQAQAMIKLGAPTDDQIHVSVDKKCGSLARCSAPEATSSLYLR